MKILNLTENLSHKASVVWEVISDISRTDWVPGVDKISLNEDTREFFMEGMGKIKEKIVLCDHENKILKYSAIESPVELNHHLACIEISENKMGCDFKWTTEIDPEIYSSGIEQGMISSLKQLKKILNNQLP
ncbi:MAG: SRPBCC family protein [SAR86 cluster bacterium]|nr:SRPBCC family protein [SAR86 cluster bacterium]